MAIKFEKITAGMRLWDVHRERMGMTMMYEWGAWPVYVISVDPVKREATVRWNGNPPETRSAKRMQRLYVKFPKHYRDQEARLGRRIGSMG